MSTTPRTIPGNAFADDFLNRLDRLPEPDGAHEAASKGPWTVTPVTYLGSPGFALLREGESLADGDEPFAVFRRRETALLAAAVLPATGRDPLFRLHTDPDAAGFPLHSPPSRHQARHPGTVDPIDLAAEPSQPGHIGPDQGPAKSAAQAASAGLRPDAADAADPIEATDADASAAGHLRDFDEDFVAALHVAAMLARSPRALASLLEAAGHVCLENTGRILAKKLR